MSESTQNLTKENEFNSQRGLNFENNAPNQNNVGHESVLISNIANDYKQSEVEKKKPKGFSASVKRLQNTVKEQRVRHAAKIKFAISMCIHVLLLGYFCWATQYFVSNQTVSLASTTCEGYGFLMILYICSYFLVFYYIIFKPVILPPIAGVLKSPYKSVSSIRHIGLIIHLLILVGCLIFLVVDSWTDTSRLVPIAGLVFFLLFGFVFSSNHLKVNWNTVIAGLDLQFIFGLLTIRWDVGRDVFSCIGDKATIFLGFANNGSSFVYGDDLIYEQAIFAFQALSTIFFIGFVVNILYHYGIMQKIIVTIGEFLKFFMGTTICESVNSAANIFLGQSESPILLRPYLEQMTDSEIHSIMTSGFATVSGSVLAAYISFGASASDLITASVMSAPAALCFSKLFYPETEEIKANSKTVSLAKTNFSSALDAASKGAHQALDIVLGIISNIIAFIAFVAFISAILEWMGSLVGYVDESEKWTVYRLVGYVFMPVSFLMGVPWKECEMVGRLIGIKTIVNEFAAFREMGTMELSPRTKVIATFAICGFANPGSIGIQISALSAMAPCRRDTIVRLVFRAFVGGCIVCFMTACIAAMLMPESALT